MVAGGGESAPEERPIRQEVEPPDDTEGPLTALELDELFLAVIAQDDEASLAYGPDYNAEHGVNEDGDAPDAEVEP